jgi:hypothetical protein
VSYRFPPLAAWQLDYNTVRSHSSLGNLPPAHYAMLSSPASQRDGSLRYRGYTPRPLQHRAKQAQVGNRLYPSPDERRGSGHRRSGIPLISVVLPPKRGAPAERLRYTGKGCR